MYLHLHICMHTSQMMQLKTAFLPGFFEPVHTSLLYPDSVIDGTLGATFIQVLSTTSDLC